MRISKAHLNSEMDAFMSNVALGRPWLGMLDRLSTSVNSHSACLSRVADKQLRLLNTRMHAQTMQMIGRNGNPPYTNDVLTPPKRSDGFLSDASAEVQSKLRRVPLYTDFMVKNEFGWRATVHLDGPETQEGVRLTFWRGRFEGAFSDEDLADMTPLVWASRFAARFAKSQLEGFSRDAATPFEKRGDAVFGLDISGKAMPINAAAEGMTSPRPHLVGGRIAVPLPGDQRRLDASIARAAAGVMRACIVNLAGEAGSTRLQVLLLPIRGEARDIFGAVRALAVVVDLDRPVWLDPDVLDLLREGFDLTRREGDVVKGIAAGISVADIAMRLGMGEGTTRNHAKAVFQKMGVHSQSELAAVVTRYH